jgi:membrane protein
MSWHDRWRLLKDAGVKFSDDNASRLGAALAFYTALSLSPLLLAVVGIAGLVFGERAARGELVGQLRDTVGPQGAGVIEQVLAHGAHSSGGWVAVAVGFAVALYGASNVFSALRGALNSVWNVPGSAHESGLWAMIHGRLHAFLLVCGVAFLLLVSLVVSAVLSGINDRIAGWLPGMTALAEVANFLVTLGIITLLFAMIFKWLPDTELPWSDVWGGAAVTALLFSLGKYLIGLYLGQAAVGSAYGAAGAFVVLLVWLYYSAQIMLFGAELTFVYARRYGSGVGAVREGAAESHAPQGVVAPRPA